MSGIIRKEQNVSTLMCHIVCPAKYRREVIADHLMVKAMDTRNPPAEIISKMLSEQIAAEA
jgi:REP element-mobilizing transposase RayT